MSTPSSWRTTRASAIPASHASTLASRRGREPSPNGNHRRWRGAAGSGGMGRTVSVTTHAQVAVRQDDPASPHRDEATRGVVTPREMPIHGLMPRLPSDPIRRRAVARVGAAALVLPVLVGVLYATVGVPASSQLAAWAQSAGPAAPAVFVLI